MGTYLVIGLLAFFIALPLNAHSDKLSGFDVVGAVMINEQGGTGAPFSEVIPNPLVGTGAPPFEFGQKGSRFLAEARIYPLGTFNKKGPFVIDATSIEDIKPFPGSIGEWFCNGIITRPLPQIVPGGNQPFGNSTIQFLFLDEQGKLIKNEDNSVFVQDTLIQIDSSTVNTGKPARFQNGIVIGGLNKNSHLKGDVKITTYLSVGPSGIVQFMNRYEFSEKVTVKSK